MTLTLELPPEVEARAVAEARARGLSVHAVLQEAIAARFRNSATQAGMTPQERARALREWAKGHRRTPPLSNEAISRESLYGERRR